MIFRFLITLFLFYLAFRFLFRLISGTSSSANVFTFGQATREREEGDVTIHTQQTRKSNRNNTEGEYVDFEEVK